MFLSRPAATGVRVVTTKSENADVVIAGTGLTALAMALGLARANVRVKLVGARASEAERVRLLCPSISENFSTVLACGASCSVTRKIYGEL